MYPTVTHSFFIWEVNVRPLLQKELARRITSRVHGSSSYDQCVRVSNILFGKNTADQLKEITEEEFLMVFEGVDQYHADRSSLTNGTDVTTLLTDLSGAFNSKGEVRRLLQSNAISINKLKVNIETTIASSDLLNNKYLLIQKGKKHYIIICFK